MMLSTMPHYEPASCEALAEGDCAASHAGRSSDKLSSDTAESSSTGQVVTIDELIDQFYADVYRYAYRLLGCPVAAEDVVQSVYMSAVKHIGQLRDRQAAKGWLMSITRREYLRWLRTKSQSRSVQSVDMELVADDGGSNESVSDVDRLEQQDWIQKAILQLSEESRVTLLMYYFEQLSYSEIAERLSIPIGTVMSRLSRGRKLLQECLERAACPKCNLKAASHDSIAAHPSLPTPHKASRKDNATHRTGDPT